MSGPRADWPGPAITWADVAAQQRIIYAERERRVATVDPMPAFWFAVVDRWWPENGTADVTVYEYPTAEPTPDGRQVWGCELYDVDRAEDLVPAATKRLEPTKWRLLDGWKQEGDRWIAPIAPSEGRP